jgi:hypothetical protein
MIPHLLWRCPLCAANDALVHMARWPWRERVDCKHCHARWQVRRAVGDNFYLKLISANPPVERSITAWYDEMKKTLRLEALPTSPIPLDAGETLLLASQPAEMWAEPPHAAGGREPERIGGLVGRGQVYLTDQRLLWVEDHVGKGAWHTPQREHVSFPLRTVNGIYAILTLGIAVNTGLQITFFRLPHESPLKWVTYAAMLSPQIEAATGRKLVTSHD